jgi:riboflavin kinase / FMN adenylyltransferase
LTLRSLHEAGPDFGPSIVTIGNFDGIHAGHRRILRRVVEVAKERGAKPCVLTFAPHPATVVAPERAPKLLMTLAQRSAAMHAEGIEDVLILPFDREFSRMTPEEFCREILIDHMQARAVLVGANFRFGGKQEGDVEVLRELGRRLGFDTEIVPGVSVHGRLVSSTAVRRLVAAGAISRAARYLEQPYALEGTVVRGHGIGSKQTVPTLNLDTAAEVLPAQGVYVTRTRDLDDGRAWHSVTNLGFRPTFAGERLAIETFLLDPFDGIDPRRMCIEFLYRLRGERKFETPDALKAQIFKDVSRAQTLFRRLTAIGAPRPL